jgi:hypothetical protein
LFPPPFFKLKVILQEVKLMGERQKYVLIKNCTEVDERFRDHVGTPRALSKKGTRNSFVKIIIDEKDWAFAANYYNSMRKANHDLQVSLSVPAKDVISEDKIKVYRPQSLTKSQVQVRARQIRDDAKKRRRNAVAVRLAEIRKNLRIKKHEGNAAEDTLPKELNKIQRQSKTGDVRVDLGIADSGDLTLEKLNTLEDMQIYEIAQEKGVEIDDKKDIDQIKREILEKP